MDYGTVFLILMILVIVVGLVMFYNDKKNVAYGEDSLVGETSEGINSLSVAST